MRFPPSQRHRAFVVIALLASPLVAAPAASASTAHATLTNVRYTVRLEDQLLATLNYLPVSFRPKTATPPPTTTTTTSTSTTTTTTTTTTTVPPALKHSVAKPPQIPTRISLQPGTFAWRFGSLPRVLEAQWSVGTNNVVLEGALMHFQLVHNLATTGAMNVVTWHALLLAALRREFDPAPYDTVFVNQALPQRLYLYQNDTMIFTTLVNTGIAVSPTANGTYPVYLRYTTTTMSGTNPNGSHYHDTGIPWVSYFNGGDALHGFIRASYGWPQSLGCVEMPFADAAVVWPRTPIGTLVTVQ